jgi:hypothetical protein
MTQRARRAYFLPAQSPAQAQRGFPAPLNQTETRAAYGQPFGNVAPFGGKILVQPRRRDLGASGYVPNFGKPFSNPIGAGVVALNRPQPSYGISSEYIAHALFWSSQTIPTTIPMGPLVSRDTMQALLGTINIKAVLPTA